MKDLGLAQSCLSASKWINRHISEKYLSVSACQTANQLAHQATTMTQNKNVLVGKVPYQEAVGSLLHLTQGTRPDVVFAVNNVSRFNKNHPTDHWQAVKRIVRYLRGIIHYKLTCYSNDNNGLRGGAFAQGRQPAGAANCQIGNLVVDDRIDQSSPFQLTPRRSTKCHVVK